ncbi:MAG: hypothetical protein MUF64_16410, partial [Polyangiaceae bacterium]|nr:hypothetical protein [Polyangiaceae bacterium]
HDLGYKTKIHPNAYAVHHQAAGSGEQKAESYHDFVKDEDVALKAMEAVEEVIIKKKKSKKQ